MSEGHVAPITSSERIGELDALRGFALLGVFIANYTWWTFLGYTSVEADQGRWMADPINPATIQAVFWLVSDKANTLFGVLFGIGFWIQMSRMSVRGADAERLYLRRLTVLLGIGLVNLWLLFPWDILTVYATAGFLLFALRKISMRAMLVAGILLFLLSRPVVKGFSRETGLLDYGNSLTEKAVFREERQDVLLNGDYLDWVANFGELTVHGFLLSGIFIGWIFYALGRFLVGAWIARNGWLERVAELRPKIGKIALVALPLGLAMEYVHVQSHFGDVELNHHVRDALHMVGLAIAALGYACGLLWLYHSKAMGWLPRLFAPVGRMALTAYISHGIILMFVLTGIGPGLQQAGVIGPFDTLLLAIGVFVGLSIFSHLWLSAFRYGPLEYAWRTLTYGHAPAFRRKRTLQTG